MLLKNHVFRLKIAAFAVISIFLCFSAASTKPVCASQGSIANANCYPSDGETYGSIDHFSKQITADNTNTTVSVSIDGGSPIPMIYQGMINETVQGDSAVRSWFTWQVVIPALTAPGRHTFQFFDHHYVWQDEDQYWAEFNAYSTVKSFTIGHSLPTPQSTSNSTDPQTPPSSQASPSEPQSNLFSPTETLNTTAAATILVNVVAVAALLRKRR